MHTTRNLFLLSLMLIFVGTACKTTKSAVWTPVGSWDYTVADTPNGDVSGTLVISETNGAYSGELRTEEGSMELEDVKIEDNKLTAILNYQGYELNLEGVFTGEMMNGEISMGYDSFTITASRESSN